MSQGMNQKWFHKRKSVDLGYVRLRNKNIKYTYITS